MEELVEELAKCFNIKPNDISKNPFVASLIKNIDKELLPDVKQHNIPVNVQNYERFVVVLFELPGVFKKDISLSLSSDFVLRVSVKKTIIADNESVEFLQREIVEGKLTRSISLPETVGKSMTAKYDNGLLTVTFKKQHVDVTEITIE